MPEKTYAIKEIEGEAEELVETKITSTTRTKSYTKEKVEAMIVRNLERKDELQAMLALFK